MRKFFIIFALLFLSGCTLMPTSEDSKQLTGYVDIGLGYRVEAFSDWYLNSDREWNGRQPTFEGALGLKFRNTRCEVYHWSHLRDGGPWNHNPELYELKGRCMYMREFTFWRTK